MIGVACRLEGKLKYDGKPGRICLAIELSLKGFTLVAPGKAFLNLSK